MPLNQIIINQSVMIVDNFSVVINTSRKNIINNDLNDTIDNY